MSTISVIVPVYNVQEYLENCVHSIINQTYSDFELLLVDDGSTDGSGELCDKFHAIDNRISVIHKKNGGLSDARNVGIDNTTSPYITFIDSDDYIAPDFLEELLRLHTDCNADVSCVNLTETRVVKNSIPSGTVKRKGCVSGETAVKNSLVRTNFGVSACGKLFKRSCFEELKFPYDTLFEDLFTIPYILEKCEKVAFLEGELYFYYVRAGSITNSTITEKHLEFFDNYNNLLSHFRLKKELYDAAVERFMIESIKRFSDKVLFSSNYKSNIKVIKEKSNEIWEYGLKNTNLPSSIRIQINILRFDPTLYRLLFYYYKSKKL